MKLVKLLLPKRTGNFVKKYIKIALKINPSPELFRRKQHAEHPEAFLIPGTPTTSNKTSRNGRGR